MKRQVSQVTNETSAVTVPPTPPVFDAIHSVDARAKAVSDNLERKNPLTTALARNPLLLNITSYEQPIADTSNLAKCKTSSASNSLSEGTSNSTMHMSQIFDGTHDQVKKISCRK